MDNVGVVVLAAGRGSRMKLKDINKVAISLNDKPLILRSLEIIKSSGIKEIIVVVGFAKESVIKLLPDGVKVVVQEEFLGTADAEKVGIEALSPDIKYVLSVYGDDSFLYTKEIFNKIIDVHKSSNAVMTLATIILDDPTGYGRIIRDKNGKIVRIVEELSASDEEKKIKEVNTGCYLFSREFIDKNIGKIKINELKKEYYLTDILEIFVKDEYLISSISIPSKNWKGVNTIEELRKAERELVENE